MGASLARAAQWTTVSESGQGKLELSPMNEKLLNDIIQVWAKFYNVLAYNLKVSCKSLHIACL